MLSQFCSDVLSRVRQEEGATAVEYGLIVAMIAAVVAGVVLALGTQVAAAFEGAVGKF